MWMKVSNAHYNRVGKEKLQEILSSEDPHYAENPEIKWNFTKFVIDREGEVAARYEPTASMREIESCIKELL